MPDCGLDHYGINEYLDGLRKEAFEKKIPIKGVFELTPRCNFNCNMCYVHLQPDQIAAVGREMTTQEWIEVARQAQQAGTLELTLTGGEPFVRPDFRQLYEALHDMGFLIQIFSNGSMIDDGVAAWLTQRPPRSVRFTLYGASDETYEKVCGVRGGFTRVLRSIETLRAAGIPLYLVATATKENIHELGAMYRVAQRYGLPMIHTSDLVNPVRGATADAKAHEVQWAVPPADEIRRLRAQPNPEFPRKPCKDFLSVCGNYRKGFWISWSGSMQLCAFLTEPAVSVREAPFGQCWQRLVEEIARLRQPAACDNCEYERYCKRCPGILYAETGANGKIASSLCQKAWYNYILYGRPLEE